MAKKHQKAQRHILVNLLADIGLFFRDLGVGIAHIFNHARGVGLAVVIWFGVSICIGTANWFMDKHIKMGFWSVLKESSFMRKTCPSLVTNWLAMALAVLGLVIALVICCIIIYGIWRGLDWLFKSVDHATKGFRFSVINAYYNKLEAHDKKVHARRERKSK